MELKYKLSEYIVMARMSSKIRVLVEGKDDRGHVLNLFGLFIPKAKLKVDIALDIVGDCNMTRTNNRAKIEKIHLHCKDKAIYRKLFFLCDREFRGFNVDDAIEDFNAEHEVDGNMSWTLGHSIENYFLSPLMLSDGFRYLSGSGRKIQALELFSNIFDDSMRKIAAVTLAARELNCAGYPVGIIKWSDIVVANDSVDLGLSKELMKDQFLDNFVSVYDKYLAVAEKTGSDICARLCRGHTAVVILQRLFSACLYAAGKTVDEETAKYDANLFNNLPETSISSALSEAWVKTVAEGQSQYPRPLVELVSSVA